MTATCAPSTEDRYVDAGGGRLFVRQWAPPALSGTAAVPIVLFHDSLGCVEPWRDFPERLAMGTRRRMIAYDRLGFGHSDPHPSRLGRGFVHDEAQHGFRAMREALGLQRVRNGPRAAMSRIVTEAMP